MNIGSSGDLGFDWHGATGYSFRDEVLEGLSRTPKVLSSKLLYDKRGSELFERICELPEYYLTRTETEILKRNAHEISDLCGERCLLIELGSGSSTKTRILLDHLRTPAAYVPVDIARDQLLQAANSIARDYRWLEVIPVCADYTRAFAGPLTRRIGRKHIAFFPGSTIGNFEPHETLAFLRQFAHSGERNDAMIAGVDLRKSPAILEPAYNDSQGVTAEFNLNLLHRINRELGAEIRPAMFRHEAIYNEPAGRIEMHLVSLADQVCELDGSKIHFTRGERITTEYSYKYGVEEFTNIANSAGLITRRRWTDDQKRFAIFYLEVAAER
jgi:dimethylhistidine N-methyltransferase